jgi:predicted porin
MKNQILATLTMALSMATAAAHAQSSVTVYGNIDQYLNYMRSSSGATVKSLEDGAYLRSRLGFKGYEDLGDGYGAKFQMEGGLSADTGTQADGTRFLVCRRRMPKCASVVRTVRCRRAEATSTTRHVISDR